MGAERIDPYNIADAAVQAAWWVLVDWGGDGVLRIWRIDPGYEPQPLPRGYWVRQRLLGDLYPWTDLSRYEVLRTDLEHLLKKLPLPAPTTKKRRQDESQPPRRRGGRPAVVTTAVQNWWSKLSDEDRSREASVLAQIYLSEAKVGSFSRVSRVIAALKQGGQNQA